MEPESSSDESYNEERIVSCNAIKSQNQLLKFVASERNGDYIRKNLKKKEIRERRRSSSFDNSF